MQIWLQETSLQSTNIRTVVSYLDFLWGQEGRITNAHWGYFLHGYGWQIRHYFNFRNRLEKR